MADRQHEAVTVGPDRMVGVEAQKALPQAIDHRCQGHRRSRMAGVRLLHGIHCQRADGIDAQLVERVVRPSGILRRSWTHGRPTTRSGHGWARSDGRGRNATRVATDNRPREPGPWAAPGWPEFAFTASIPSVRMVLTHNWSIFIRWGSAPPRLGRSRGPHRSRAAPSHRVVQQFGILRQSVRADMVVLMVVPQCAFAVGRAQGSRLRAQGRAQSSQPCDWDHDDLPLSPEP